LLMHVKDTAMNDRLIDLESRLAFQEHTLEELNQVVIEQQRQLALLTERLRVLEERVRASQPSQIATEAEESPPPHY
jgi:SlyX protein